MPKSLPKVNSQIITLTPGLNSPTSQFPSIFRFIPEKTAVLYKIISIAKIIILCLISVYLLYATLKQGQLLLNNREYYKKITLQRQNLEKELAYWEKIAEKYNNYPDAYLKIASLEYNLGNTQASKAYIEKALSMNPDIETGKVVLGEHISR